MNGIVEYASGQIEEIKKYKWIESEKVGYDLGSNAVVDWISKYARSYRDYWINSRFNVGSGYVD